MEIDRSSFYQKHKKHKATSQQKYRLLVQQSFEWKKMSDPSQIKLQVNRSTVIINFYRLV